MSTASTRNLDLEDYRSYLKLLADIQKNPRLRAKENASIEISLDQQLQESAVRIMGELPAEQTSPSQQVIRLERAEQFADVIMRLFKDEYTAVLLKHVHDRKFDQMAEHLGRSPEAVAGLLGEA